MLGQINKCPTGFWAFKKKVFQEMFNTLGGIQEAPLVRHHLTGKYIKKPSTPFRLRSHWHNSWLFDLSFVFLRCLPKQAGKVVNVFAPCIQNLAEIFPVFVPRVHGQTLKKGVLTKKSSVKFEYDMGSKQLQPKLFWLGLILW